MATAIPINQQQQAISSAASAYGVPESILWGVYGIETDFGRNISTSSAGAVGAFQFLPSTAKGFGYPLTNSPTYAQFWQQAQGAAKYLQQLKQQTGSWDTALQHYSGGGYGLSQVTAKATSAESKALSGQGFYPGLIASMATAGILAGAGAAERQRTPRSRAARRGSARPRLGSARARRASARPKHSRLPKLSEPGPPSLASGPR